MKSFNYVIKEELGLHARPAGILAKQAKGYESKVTITKAEKSAEATRLMAVMALAVKQGEEVTVDVEGADEDKAVEEIKAFFEANF